MPISALQWYGTPRCQVVLLCVCAGVELNDDELALVLAGLSELRISCLENDAACAQIADLAERLGGDRGTMFYGAPAPDRR